MKKKWMILAGLVVLAVASVAYAVVGPGSQSAGDPTCHPTAGCPCMGGE